jgi:hypothetical protein
MTLDLNKKKKEIVMRDLYDFLETATLFLLLVGAVLFIVYAFCIA